MLPKIDGKIHFDQNKYSESFGKAYLFTKEHQRRERNLSIYKIEDDLHDDDFEVCQERLFHLSRDFTLPTEDIVVEPKKFAEVNRKIQKQRLQSPNISVPAEVPTDYSFRTGNYPKFERHRVKLHQYCRKLKDSNEHLETLRHMYHHNHSSQASVASKASSLHDPKPVAIVTGKEIDAKEDKKEHEIEPIDLKAILRAAEKSNKLKLKQQHLHETINNDNDDVIHEDDDEFDESGDIFDELGKTEEEISAKYSKLSSSRIPKHDPRYNPDSILNLTNSTEFQLSKEKKITMRAIDRTVFWTARRFERRFDDKIKRRKSMIRQGKWLQDKIQRAMKVAQMNAGFSSHETLANSNSNIENNNDIIRASTPFVVGASNNTMTSSPSKLGQIGRIDSAKNLTPLSIPTISMENLLNREKYRDRRGGATPKKKSSANLLLLKQATGGGIQSPNKQNALSRSSTGSIVPFAGSTNDIMHYVNVTSQPSTPLVMSRQPTFQRMNSNMSDIMMMSNMMSTVPETPKSGGGGGSSGSGQFSPMKSPIKTRPNSATKVRKTPSNHDLTADYRAFLVSLEQQRSQTASPDKNNNNSNSNVDLTNNAATDSTNNQATTTTTTTTSTTTEKSIGAKIIENANKLKRTNTAPLSLSITNPQITFDINAHGKIVEVQLKSNEAPTRPKSADTMLKEANKRRRQRPITSFFLQRNFSSDATDMLGSPMNPVRAFIGFGSNSTDHHKLQAMDDIIRINDADALEERNLLMMIFNQCGGKKWIHKENWGSLLPVKKWYGVGCTVAGYVFELDLASNNLIGPFPDSLDKFQKLEVVNFDNNQLNGDLPEYSLSKIYNLSILSARNNQLTGTIPFNLMDSLIQLKELWLSENHFTGRLQEGISKLISLTHLCLYHNHIRGIIPPGICKLHKLEYLSLGCNELTGHIPETIISLHNIRTLSLYNNKLTGKVPDWLESFDYLEDLELFNNSFEGFVPSSVEHLAKYNFR